MPKPEPGIPAALDQSVAFADEVIDEAIADARAFLGEYRDSAAATSAMLNVLAAPTRENPRIAALWLCRAIVRLAMANEGGG
jgi:hypothetical protein